MGKGPKAPGETSAEKAYADIGVDRYQLAEKTRPARDELFKRISSFRQQRQQGRNLSTADMALAKNDVREAARKSPGGSAIPATGLRLASAGADQAASTERNLDKAHVTGLQGLTSMALGESGAAIQGMGELAQTSQRDAIARARNAAQRSAATNEAIGSAVGLAATAFGGKTKPPGTTDYEIGGPLGPDLNGG